MRASKIVSLTAALVLAGRLSHAADAGTEAPVVDRSARADAGSEPVADAGKEGAERMRLTEEGFPTLSFDLPAPVARLPRSIHPPVPFLDARGAPVVEKGTPLSLMKSCGECHDTEFIAEHNYHAHVGAPTGERGDTGGNRPGDLGTGLFGRFDPLTYRRLTAPGDARFDMGVADWIREMGSRHAGGGPARRTPDGTLLTGLEPTTKPSIWTHVQTPETGEPRPWDWQASGTVENNCLLCHMEKPNNSARIEALKNGDFRWASTATLVGKPLVEKSDGGYAWVRSAFRNDGSVDARLLKLGDPDNGNCRQCHGRACRCTDPVVFENSADNWAVETTGHVFSAEQISESGMNVAGKAGLHTPWDVHAQRLLRCSNCHHAMNNPAYNVKESPVSRPAHLAFDARKLSQAQYLLRPDHNLAKGHTAQGTAARRFDGSMRGCRDCHRPLEVHSFLPNKRTHFEKVGCATCHIPRVFTPVRQVTDWTVLRSGGQPLIEHRGIAGPINSPASLIEGFEPIPMIHQEVGGELSVEPHNLAASWFWISGDPGAPVRKWDLERALFQEPGKYHPEIVAVLDADGDGKLGDDELRLTSKEKVAAIAARLRAVGVDGPEIAGEIQPYTMGHGVVDVDRAIRRCESCHSRESRMTRPVELSPYVPGGVVPDPVGDSTAELRGDFEIRQDGSLAFEPQIDGDFMYIHGTNTLAVFDVLGVLLVLGTLAGVFIHGGLRLRIARRRRDQEESQGGAQ